MSSSQDKRTLQLEEGVMEGCSKTNKGTRAKMGGRKGVRSKFGNLERMCFLNAPKHF